MIKKWIRAIFLNTKKIDERTERLIKEAKIRAAELAVFKESEIIRLKTKLARA